MKVLYVEDQIVENIPGIIDLLRPLLGKNVVNQLETLNKSEYPAELDEIKQVVESSAAVDLAYSFPMALEMIEKNHDTYSIFILDRNLKTRSYEHEEIKNIIDFYSEDDWLKYDGREGDFLLWHLHMKKVDLLERVFILSAYSEALKLDEKIKALISYDEFRKENFVEKGNQDTTDRLKFFILSLPHLDVIIEYRCVFRVLSSPLFSNEDLNLFTNMITRVKNNDSTSIDIVISNSRKLLERIFICLYKFDEKFIPLKSLTENDEARVKCRGIFRHLIDSGKLKKNSIPDKFNWLVYPLCSDLMHGDIELKDYIPTKHTARAIFEMLCDLILWAGKFASKPSS